LSSGKFNRYQVTNFDAQFSEVGSKELLSGNLTFDGAELIGDMLFFTHKNLYNSGMNQKYPYCFLGRNKDMS